LIDQRGLKMSKMQAKRERYLKTIHDVHGDGKNDLMFTNAELLEAEEEYQIPLKWIRKELKEGRNEYRVPRPENYVYATREPHKHDKVKETKTESVEANEQAVKSDPNEAEANDNIGLLFANESLPVGALIPQECKAYVGWGNHDIINSTISSGIFAPVWISGQSGCGKTYQVEQICHSNKREMIRVNITAETCEDDLIGGFRLINGNMVWQYGPVTEAMQRGAVCLIDEIDLGSNEIMCLQPILEGKGIYIKKINKHIEPAKGFTIIATGNTKGTGDYDGKFIGTRIQNEALQDRFAFVIEQDYPEAKVEKKILANHVKMIEAESNGIFDGCDVNNMIGNLVKWSDGIRSSFKNGASDITMSTRRMVHAIKTYGIVKDEVKAIEFILNRYDDEIKSNFLKLYKYLAGDDGKMKESVTVRDDSAIS